MDREPPLVHEGLGDHLPRDVATLARTAAHVRGHCAAFERDRMVAAGEFTFYFHVLIPSPIQRTIKPQERFCVKCEIVSAKKNPGCYTGAPGRRPSSDHAVVDRFGQLVAFVFQPVLDLFGLLFIGRCLVTFAIQLGLEVIVERLHVALGAVTGIDALL